MKPAYSLSQLVLYFLKLGYSGFGGPVALIGYMHRDLVEERKWISEDDYREGLALAQLSPGPLAAQLGIYIGFIHYRIWGATLTGIAFVLPSFLMVLAIGIAYKIYGGLEWMQAIFFGVGACVIGIIALSAFKLTIKSIGALSTDSFKKNLLLWMFYFVCAAITIITGKEDVWFFLGAGLLYMMVKAPPAWMKSKTSMVVFLAAGIVWTGSTNTLTEIAFFFAKAGAFVFGSGLAIVPFLHSGVVDQYHWLNEKEFLDAVAVAMITPGPVVITVGFIGYLVAGVSGASVAALATFLPCYLLTIIPAPYFKKYGKNPSIKAFVDGITAAVIGALSGAVIVMAQRTFFSTQSWRDIIPIAICAVTMFVMVRFNKIKEPILIAAAALIGLAVKFLLF